MAVESQGFQPGAGDPYWYEWYVGLGYVVSLLSGADDVAAVTFQKAGLEGVDDVVVQRSNSRPSVCIQVKHEKASTNIKSNLTFGMLVDGSEKKGALIRSLALGWKQMFREAGVSPEVILYTNRSFGSNRTTRTFQQKTYSCLPIVDFMKEARAVLLGINSLGEISFCSDGLQLQWEEFVHAIGMDPEDTLEFLKSLNIKAEAPSLREIENNLLERIASEVCLGSQALVEKIFMCLKAELSKSTSRPNG